MRQFLKYCIGFGLPLLIFPLLIFIIDPMGLFRQDFSQQMIEPNQHYVKMRWLLEESRPYDSFLFGSSKAGNIDTRKLADGKWYNMTYSMGVPLEWKRDIERLIEFGYDINQVVICLDEFSYIRTAGENTSLLRTPYPENAWANYKFLAGYLLRFPNFEVLKEATPSFNSLGPYRVKYDIYQTGIPFKDAREAYIDENIETHLQDSRFDINWPDRIPNGQESIEAIAAIRTLCKDQNIQLKVVYLPVFEKKLQQVKANGFDAYKAEVLATGPVIDLSEDENIIHDRRLWFEQIHFRQRVGDIIVGKINDSEVEIARKPRNFATNEGGNK